MSATTEMRPCVGRGRGQRKLLQKGSLGNLQPKKLSEKEECKQYPEFVNSTADQFKPTQVNEQKNAIKENNKPQTLHTLDAVSGKLNDIHLKETPKDSELLPKINSASQKSSETNFDPVLISALSAPAFAPKGNVEGCSDITPMPNGNSDGAETDTSSEYLELEHNVFTDFRDIVVQLTEEPDVYDDIIESATVLLSVIIRMDTMQAIVDLIFEQAIYFYNFRYSAAKLVTHLGECKELEVVDGTKFRTLFLKKCQSEFEELKANIKSQSSPEAILRATSMAYLFGELCCSMEVARQHIFKPVIFEIVELFIEHPNDEFISCLANLLKLVGPILDVDRPRDVEEVFVKVREFKLDTKKNAQIDQEKLNALFKVYKLHTRDWDRYVTPVSRTPVYAQEKFELPEATKRLMRGSTSSVNDTDWNDFYIGNDEECFAGETENLTAEFEQFLNGEEMDAYEMFLRESGQL